jgi:hypothetical protein
MQREGRPSNANFVFRFQAVDPTGDEIAPGSDVIGKYFQYLSVRHETPCFELMIEILGPIKIIWKI